MLKQPPSKPALNNSSVPEHLQAPESQSDIETNVDAIAQSTESPETSAPKQESVESSDPKKRFPFVFSKVKQASRAVRQVAHKPAGKIALALMLVGTGSGIAFAQVAPPELKTEIKDAITPQRPSAPVSKPNDPEVETFTSTQDLFLTNQIFYRKVEALAGVTLANPPGAKADATPADKAKKTANASSKANKPQTAGNAEKAKADKAAESQAEKVTAVAPPAPAAEEILFTGTTIDSVLEMRVAVAKDVSAVGFATSSNGSITDLEGNVLKSLPAETASLAEISNGVTVDGEPIPGGAFWIYPEDGGYVAVGDRWYRGRVLVALRERGLIAVNYVFLGDYLYSVVGSEMSPDWSIESLKAQAVAARSYALTHNIHPASEAYFDLDNTQRFQAYKGIGREASTTQIAVQATAGEFISHEGGIVESLYAASQEIVDDAHKGSGMSQLGAKDLAEQGYSYVEILGHYYPGTALGRIETDSE